MTLYIAVTPDELELPLLVTDSARVMAAWAGIKVESVHEICCRNGMKPPWTPGCKCGKYRLRKIKVEENEG